MQTRLSRLAYDNGAVSLCTGNLTRQQVTYMYRSSSSSSSYNNYQGNNNNNNIHT